MTEPDLERLEDVIHRITAGEPIGDQITAEELRKIAADLETGKKYQCSTCQMYCTGEDVMVIYNTDTEEFIQLEIPMDEDQEIVVTRAA